MVNSPNAVTEESSCPFGDNFGALAGAMLSVCCPKTAQLIPFVAALLVSSDLLVPAADLANHNELCKLSLGQYRQMFLP